MRIDRGGEFDACAIFPPRFLTRTWSRVLENVACICARGLQRTLPVGVMSLFVSPRLPPPPRIRSLVYSSWTVYSCAYECRCRFWLLGLDSFRLAFSSLLRFCFFVVLLDRVALRGSPDPENPPVLGAQQSLGDAGLVACRFRPNACDVSAAMGASMPRGAATRAGS